jgi:acetate kinase
MNDATRRVLVVNAGSSSVKLRVLDGETLTASVDLPGVGDEVDDAALARELDGTGALDAIGHRVVHGGTEFVAPVRLDDDVIERLDRLCELAPLHQPPALALVRAMRRLRPDLPAVACFDTAFHATLPAAAATYAIPESWRALGLRVYGFHGLSHAWAARRAAELLGRPITALRIVSCHLGAGASLAAIDDGRSVDTTMGFTPMDGLVMATRSGSFDPGALLWLARRNGHTIDKLEVALLHGSGLVALAGTADMRVVTEAAMRGEPAGTLALDVYLHRLRKLIGAMAAAIDGIDALVFTAGVGEHSALVRARATAGLGFLGVEIDAETNATAKADVDISSASARARTLVIESREDLEIARGVRAALSQGQRSGGNPDASSTTGVSR